MPLPFLHILRLDEALTNVIMDPPTILSQKSDGRKRIAHIAHVQKAILELGHCRHHSVKNSEETT